MTERRSNCPIAISLDLLGDRWTLLVLRDLFMGKRRFADFLDSPEGIATNILTDRLKRLECAGILRRRSYQEKPARYEYHLTRRGADTLPILQAGARWAKAHFSDAWEPPRGFWELTPDDWWSRNSHDGDPGAVSE